MYAFINEKPKKYWYTVYILFPIDGNGIIRISIRRTAPPFKELPVPFFSDLHLKINMDLS